MTEWANSSFFFSSHNKQSNDLPFDGKTKRVHWPGDGKIKQGHYFRQMSYCLLRSHSQWTCLVLPSKSSDDVISIRHHLYCVLHQMECCSREKYGGSLSDRLEHESRNSEYQRLQILRRWINTTVVLHFKIPPTVSSKPDHCDIRFRRKSANSVKRDQNRANWYAEKKREEERERIKILEEEKEKSRSKSTDPIDSVHESNRRDPVSEQHNTEEQKSAVTSTDTGGESGSREHKQRNNEMPSTSGVCVARIGGEGLQCETQKRQ